MRHQARIMSHKVTTQVEPHPAALSARRVPQVRPHQHVDTQGMFAAVGISCLLWSCACTVATPHGHAARTAPTYSPACLAAVNDPVLDSHSRRGTPSLMHLSCTPCKSSPGCALPARACTPLSHPLNHIMLTSMSQTHTHVAHAHTSTLSSTHHDIICCQQRGKPSLPPSDAYCRLPR